MGIFDAWKNRQRKAFVERAEGLAGSIQMEIAKHAYGMLVDRHGDERAYEIAAGITNYVCRFGYVNPQNSNDKDLLTLCDTERSGVLRSFEGTFKTNATGALILLGAAWAVDHAKFKAHLSLLAREGFATVGSEAPDVSRELPETDLAYMYEVALLGDSNA